MSNQQNDIINEFEKEKSEGAFDESEVECGHICSGDCRREGCNCECGEWHEVHEANEINMPIEPEPVLTNWFNKKIQPILNNL